MYWFCAGMNCAAALLSIFHFMGVCAKPFPSGLVLNIAATLIFLYLGFTSNDER